MSELLELPLWRQLVVLGPLGLALLIAAFTDLRERKVYNWLTYPTVLIGLLAHTIAMGWSGLASGLLTAIAALFLGVLILPTGFIKGGDIKLLIGVGAFLGARALFEVFFYSVFAGFALGLIMSLFTGYLFTLLKRIWRLLKGYILMLVYRTKNFKPTLEEDERSKLPFAFAIFIGAILTVTEHLYGWPGLLTWYLDGFGIKL